MTEKRIRGQRGAKSAPDLLSEEALSRVSWHRAIELWRSNEPAKLAELLRSDAAIPPAAREWLAGLAEGTAKKKRGAKPVSVDPIAKARRVLGDIELEHRFKRQLRIEQMKPRVRGETPKERALEAVAQERGMTVEQVSQAVYPRKGGVGITE